MHRSRIILVVMLAITLVIASTGARAASGFAAPAFQAQWQAGEAITPNFWGPLETAKDGQTEDYKDAQGGNRLVQYFDKGRMELTNGTVTNGLLATEIITGRIQTGDNSFQNQAPPNISIAGDAENPAPTYAGLAGKGAALLQPATSTPGAPINTMITGNGDVSTTDALIPDPAVQVGAYDDATQHNVAAAFADYRTKAGLSTIGYAISEPFRATVKVGGVSKDVMVQIFERRALTYTASNPDAFKVEMGNIGQHYFQWRYPNGTGQTQPNPNVLVGFVRPPTWKPDSTPVTVPAGVLSITNFLGPGPKQKFTIQVENQSDPPTTLDKVLAGYVIAARQKVSGSITSEAYLLDSKIGGEPAKGYQISGTRQDNSPISIISVVVFHKDKVYSFFFFANASPMPNFDDIQGILATMTFLS